VQDLPGGLPALPHGEARGLRLQLLQRGEQAASALHPIIGRAMDVSDSVPFTSVTFL
jgi:hypothetical protein